jgi:hypothetical protein
MIFRRYKKMRSGHKIILWECKVVYKDPFTLKTRKKILRGYKNKFEAERAAKELLYYIEKLQ